MREDSIKETQQEIPWESNRIELRCPECDAKDTIKVVHPQHIGVAITLTVDGIKCSECGYDSENGGGGP